jgi:short-subunit dehydrogenase
MSSGKVAIVTGASSGIGLSVAKMWAARGGRVALVARTKSKLDDVAKEIGEEKGCGRHPGALPTLP